MKTAPLRTNRDDGSFSIISLTECQEALSESNLENNTRETYFVWSWRQSRRQHSTDEGAAEVTKGGDDVAQSKNK